MEKAHVDIIQVLLTDDGPLGIACWTIIFIFILQIGKIFSACIRIVRWVWSNRGVILLRPSWAKLVICILAALVAWCFRYQLNDQIQYFEQVYLKPTYINNDTSYWAMSMYEIELKKHVSEIEFDIVKQETARAASEVGSSPLAIYEVCYSECGMNPFSANVSPRGDTVAIGWIQFTPTGIVGILLEGKQVTWKQVKSWAPARDIKAMMEATRQYLVTRSKGRKLPTSTDIYTAVFAPGFIGYSDNQALYSISTWPKAYYENIGLDGYGIVGDKIVKGGVFLDGKITVQDMRLHLAMKKAKFLRT